MRWTPFILLSALFAVMCTAQEPADLTEARQALLARALADSQRITEQYALALATREAALAAAGDYEEAKRFQQRRQQLAGIYDGVTTTQAVPLPLAGVRLMGSAQAQGDSLGNFRSNGSGAEWALFKLPPGRYHLEFEACMTDAPVAFASSKMQPQEKAALEFGEVTGLVGATNSRVAVEIARSADETTFTAVRSAEVAFTRTPLTLRLVCSNSYPANVIRLRNLRLVPIVESAPASTAAPADAKAALEEVRENLAAELDEAQKSVLAAYRGNLERLAMQDTATKTEVEAELKRLDRFADRKDSAPRFSPPGSAADGFEEVIEATLAEDEPPAAGDRFTVVHDGRKRKVRLLWVLCAPVKSDDNTLKPIAARFHLDVEDALAVGRAAQELTAGYLRGKTLRLLAKPLREGTDELEALVFLPDVGLYQNVLLDQGLGALYAPAEPKSGVSEAALLKSLFDRERAAKTRVPPAGAWALSHDNNSKK